MESIDIITNTSHRPSVEHHPDEAVQGVPSSCATRQVALDPLEFRVANGVFGMGENRGKLTQIVKEW